MTDFAQKYSCQHGRSHKNCFQLFFGDFTSLLDTITDANSKENMSL